MIYVYKGKLEVYKYVPKVANIFLSLIRNKVDISLFLSFLQVDTTIDIGKRAFDLYVDFGDAQPFSFKIIGCTKYLQTKPKVGKVEQYRADNVVLFSKTMSSLISKELNANKKCHMWVYNAGA